MLSGPYDYTSPLAALKTPYKRQHSWESSMWSGLHISLEKTFKSFLYTEIYARWTPVSNSSIGSLKNAIQKATFQCEVTSISSAFTLIQSLKKTSEGSSIQRSMPGGLQYRTPPLAASPLWEDRSSAASAASPRNSRPQRICDHLKIKWLYFSHIHSEAIKILLHLKKKYFKQILKAVLKINIVTL